jgi:hypothetical protein
MATIRNLGIWMDHANAHLIEFTKDTIETKSLVSKLMSGEKVHHPGKSEHILHNEEQQQSEYYRELAGIIMNYEDVLLFGPTNAKTELFNILQSDQHFEKVKIEVQEANKMTEKQQFAYVEEYFQNKDFAKN